MARRADFHVHDFGLDPTVAYTQEQLDAIEKQIKDQTVVQQPVQPTGVPTKAQIKSHPLNVAVNVSSLPKQKQVGHTAIGKGERRSEEKQNQNKEEKVKEKEEITAPELEYSNVSTDNNDLLVKLEDASDSTAEVDGSGKQKKNK